MSNRNKLGGTKKEKEEDGERRTEGKTDIKSG